MSGIDKDFAYFLSIKNTLLDTSTGMFALVSNQKLEGIFKTDAEAMVSGLAKFGIGNFIVQAILPDEQADRRFYSRVYA